MALQTSKEGEIPLLILKEGTKRTSGAEALRSNIAVARTVEETLKTSLGPKGLDKMLVDSFGDVTITNDGHTIVKDMEVQHPVAKMLVEVAKAQDLEVGDGTTTAVVLSGELLGKAEDLLESNIHPSVIISGYQKASSWALEELEKISLKIDPSDKEKLTEIAKTSLSSKVVAAGKGLDYLSGLAVDAVMHVAKSKDGEFYVDLDDIKVEKKKGESLEDSTLVKGIVLDKEVVHPGMPKIVKGAKIAIVNAAMEIEKPETTAKIQITSPVQLKSFLDEQTNMLRDMVEKVKATGANVLICQKGIDDIAQHFLAKAGIMAVRRAKESDMDKLAKATNARVVTSFNELTSDDLGSADLVEERKVGTEKMVFIEGCANPKSVTLLLRGGSDMLLDEAERSIHDALFVVKNVLEDGQVIAGGGAPEVELSIALKERAKSLAGKEQLAVMKYADAFEVIPSVLAETAGLSPLDALVRLKSAHMEGKKNYGIDVLKGEIADMFERKIIDPTKVKSQIIKSATEAAVMILRIDDVISAAAPPPQPPKTGEGGMGGEEYRRPKNRSSLVDQVRAHPGDRIKGIAAESGCSSSSAPRGDS
ncbi:MAG: thermosome subunit alpha [Thermoprotei archaeon]|nr:thermosome subunit alpha [TACK group archaeon]